MSFKLRVITKSPEEKTLPVKFQTDIPDTNGIVYREEVVKEAVKKFNNGENAIINYEHVSNDIVSRLIKQSIMSQLAKSVVGDIIPEPVVEKALNNNNIIKNISFDQSEILWNIMQLYNDGKPFECDMTASELKFYGKGRGKYEIPVPKYLFDVCPQTEDTVKIEKWGHLPLADESIHSIVIDLPFVISPANSPSAIDPKKGSQLIARRFAAYYPVDNLYLSYYNWLRDAYRVLDEGGICVFKCQSMISGGVRHNVEEFSYMAAQKLGFKMIDKFTLEAKARLISNAKMKNGQVHSRSYTSQFLVFIKQKKRMAKEFDYFKLLERCEKEYDEGFVNVVEK